MSETNPNCVARAVENENVTSRVSHCGKALPSWNDTLSVVVVTLTVRLREIATDRAKQLDICLHF